MERCLPCFDSSCGWLAKCSCDCHADERQPMPNPPDAMAEACAKAPAIAGHTIDKLHKKVLALQAQIRDYEHALINIVKLAGVCWAEDGRPLHDTGTVGDRVLTKYQGRFWLDVRERPFMDLTVDRDTGEVSLIRKPHKRLPVKKKGKKR